MMATYMMLLHESTAGYDGISPEEMQKMAPVARRDYVKRKAKERADLKQSIDELSAKRDVYVEAELGRRAKDGRDEGFDDQVRRTVREQAAKTGLRWE